MSNKKRDFPDKLVKIDGVLARLKIEINDETDVKNLAKVQTEIDDVRINMLTRDWIPHEIEYVERAMKRLYVATDLGKALVDKYKKLSSKKLQSGKSG